MSTALFKKNGGLNYQRRSWTEYPAFGKDWRDNWDRTFGKSKSESRRRRQKEDRPQRDAETDSQELATD